MKRPAFYPYQTWYFCLVTVLFVGPYLLLHGTNIVTNTYIFGAERFFQGLSPYVDPQGRSDFYKYAPFFCILYYPLSLLQNNLQAFLWGLINLFLYWFGVTRWEKLTPQSSKWLWFAFLACSMELDGSTRYQQINAALIGITLSALSLYRDKKYFSAGVLLALITNIKLLPIVFLLALFVPLQRKYLAGVVMTLVVAFLLPIFIIGLDKSILFHHDWLQLVANDTKGSGILDITAVLNRYGFENAKLFVALPIAIVATVFFLISRFSLKHFSWHSFISVGILTLLLLSPRTESPTFVLAGPCYVLLIAEALKKTPRTRTVSLAFIFLGIALITLTMNDIWPRKLLDVGPLRQANKTFGVLVLWCVAIFLNFVEKVGIRTKRAA